MQKNTSLGAEKRWLTTAEMIEYTALGRNLALSFAKQAGALKKVSARRNVYDRQKLDEALSRL